MKYKLLKKPKYNAHKVTCLSCKAQFLAPFNSIQGCAYLHYKCPICGGRAPVHWWTKKSYFEEAL